jgi:hypothetical protein
MDPIKVTVKAGQMEYDYDITKNKDNYIVSQQGKQVAEIECQDTWMQVSGANLPDGAFEEIIHAIDASLYQ